MTCRIADIPVPPRCRELIRSGALVAVNHSGGKDSQAMSILLSRIVPRTQLVVVHAPLGEVEWPGTIEHIEATLPASAPLILAPVASGKTLARTASRNGAGLALPQSRGGVPAIPETSGPIERELRRYLKANVRVSADGSSTPWACARRKVPARARKPPWRFNERMTPAQDATWFSTGCPVFDALDRGRLPHHPRGRPVAPLGLCGRHVETELQLLRSGIPRRSAPRRRAPPGQLYRTYVGA